MTTEDEKKPETPQELYQKWRGELEAGKKWFQKFQKAGDKVIKAYLSEQILDRDQGDDDQLSRLNLFHSNITTLTSMLYGKTPKVEVARRFAEADDDIARVAALMLTRILNTDIEVAGEDMASVFRNGLLDRLLPGLGSARVKYNVETKMETTEAITDPKTGIELAPAVEKETLDCEWTDIVYTHWKDQIWSPARMHCEIRWKAYRSYMTKDEFKARFPEIDIDKVPFSSKGPLKRSKSEMDQSETPQVEVWEIWSKDNKCVYWIVDGFDQCLDHQDDPLELDGFWPDPPPFIANVTTQKYLPKSDYAMAQDLYEEIDELETRISMLTRGCKLVGLYDKSQESIKRIFTEALENDLIPVDNWASFAEKGGLKGLIDWMPLEDAVNAIQILTQKQNDKIQQLFQVVGMSDIMRGAAMQAGTPASATERKIEASYGSIRIEALQNEFARWVGDLQSLKAEIIARHYDPQTIIEQSNIMSDENNAQYVQAAIELIKDPDKSRWRIIVRPETLAIADYAQLKQDRSEYLMGVAQFMQSSAPLIEMKPEAAPFMMKLMKWGLAGFKGSNEIESVVDQAVTAMEKVPPQPKQDPAAVKAQADMQRIQGEMEASKQEHGLKMQQSQQEFALKMQEMNAELQLNREKMQLELQQAREQFAQEMRQDQQKHVLEMRKIMLETAAEIQTQKAQAIYNIAEQKHEENIQIRSEKREDGRDNGAAKI